MDRRPECNWNKPCRCGGSGVNGDKDAECHEEEDTGKWICLCRLQRPAKKDYLKLYAFFAYIWKQKLHKGKNSGERWQDAMYDLARNNVTFNRYELLDAKNMKKKYRDQVKEWRVRLAYDQDFNSLKEYTQWDKLGMKILKDLDLSESKAKLEKVQKNRINSAKLGFENEYLGKPAYSYPVRAGRGAGAEDADSENDSGSSDSEPEVSFSVCVSVCVSTSIRPHSHRHTLSHPYPQVTDEEGVKRGVIHPRKTLASQP
jgi:hypothetical protein